MLDFMRIACAVPEVRVGDVIKNVEDICGQIKEADTVGADLVVFPELALTGYTCADLFFQDTLLNAAMEGLQKVMDCSADYPGLTVVVGTPVLLEGQMYNCGAVISAGRLHGLVPKTYLPNYNEFYERRWFSSSADLQVKEVPAALLGLSGGDIPVGRDLLFRIGDGSLLGVEICEDLWTPLPPSTLMTLNGAEVVVNLSASNETVGKRSYRRQLVKHQSAMCSCIYAYASAGCTESTSDLVFSGQSIIAENGEILAENKNIIDTDYLLVQDADLGRVRAQRRKNKSIKDTVSLYGGVNPVRVISVPGVGFRSDGTLYPLDKLPFVPSTRETRQARCMDIFQMQVAGLKQRLSVIGNANAVIGISGGLDSTLALLVAVEAMRQLGRPVSDVYGITMPCYGTSDRTYNNSWELMRTLGITAKEISIKNAVSMHFEDIGHDPSVHNGTYENSQARERTQILMDYSSTVNGIVVGTGDLSELALGWCTYNGDHMSMYGVNASIPKTLIRWLIDSIARMPEFEASRAVLEDILDTPISPELLPPDAQGKIAQYTEDLVGPYALHDFFLYYMVRYSFTPAKIFTLACRAFEDDFDAETIKKWLKSFYRRFFTQQFKRNCMPDGVKVGNISLCPRGDWRMPSDASGRIWLQEIETL
ncbi:MAG: NAD(+) synthase [Oscillospiraceae bacterium]|nr:NAD(+) synthase [Oscillospiraceae bacterium]